MRPGPEHAPTPGAAHVFRHIIAGVDGSEPGFEAARQAARLVEPGARLEIFTAVNLIEANLTGWSSQRIRAELEREAGAAMRRGLEIAGPTAESRLVNGPPPQALLDELEEQNATLAVVGTHGHSRLSEIMIGGVAGELLHDAPCSVLIARPPATGSRFPRAIAAGADGSPQSAAAVDVARYLARRFATPLAVIAARGGKDLDLAAPEAQSEVKVVDAHPVEALVEASAEADILVVGSRGLHGLRSLGSVSERVAHRARCSVLVVRVGIE